ncbi:MAG TPA: NAD-dependent epimerase/dehydratase family protein [Chitinophagaceae bacterium]|nr:NAD-dependent epimerase/dehydratase family protein [Chitinophagaceae bacterium]
MKILVTGSNGFVGKRFMEYNKDRYDLVPVLLRSGSVEDVDFTGVDAVVHLAGKAHDMKLKDETVYFNINYELAKGMADRAKKHSIPHFIYVSSVKVYDDSTLHILNETSTCNPTDAYGKSKLKAEQYLQSIASENFIVSIVRPPLVYGPGVKGNMSRFLDLTKSRSMLPFGKMGNRRSMVFVDNLIALINRIIDTKSKGIFVAGDEKPVSTESLILMIADAMGKKMKLIAMPGISRGLLKLMKPSIYKRLFGSFVIDNEQTNKSLNFIPPHSTKEGVQQMVNWYLNEKNKP